MLSAIKIIEIELKPETEKFKINQPTKESEAKTAQMMEQTEIEKARLELEKRKTEERIQAAKQKEERDQQENVK